MRRIETVLALALFLLAGCMKSKTVQNVQAVQDAEEEDIPLPEKYESDDLPMAADELFNDFVYYFANNEELQRRRIVFPLEVKNGMQTDTVEEQQWTKDPFFMTNGSYIQIFDSPEQQELPNDTTVDRVVIEHIFFSSDSVRQYQFCRNDGRWRMTGINHHRLAENPNAQFLAFYHQFATDSVFQQKSLADEIEFSGSDPEDELAPRIEGFIAADSWDTFAPVLPQDSIYNIVYAKQNGRTREKIFVICGISDEMGAELTFLQKRGRWRLTKLIE